MQSTSKEVETKELYAAMDERAEELLQSLQRRLEQAEVSPVFTSRCAILDNSLQTTTSELMTRLKKVEDDMEETYCMTHCTFDKFGLSVSDSKRSPP